MSDADHQALLDALEAHPGPVILSGYPNDLYAERLAHWGYAEAPAIAEGGGRRTEALWIKQAQAAPDLRDT